MRRSNEGKSFILLFIWPLTKKIFQNEEWWNGVDFQATIHNEKV